MKRDTQKSVRNCHCGKRASFGRELNKPMACKAHKGPDMISVSGSFCQYKEGNRYACSKRSSYGENGGKPEFCKAHKHELHVDLKHKRCKVSGCGKRAAYGEAGGTQIYCLAHKDEHHIDVCNKKCKTKGCQSQPNFGSPKTMKALRCAKHKLETDVNVTKKPKTLFEVADDAEILNQVQIRNTKAEKGFVFDVKFGSQHLLPDDDDKRTCTACKRTLGNEYFLKGKTAEAGLFKKCKDCRTPQDSKLNKSLQEKQEMIWNKKIELGGKCVQCGESDMNVLELDHIDCTKKSIKIGTNVSKEKLLEEFDKLQLLCGFCHRLKTYEDMKIKGMKSDESDPGLCRLKNIRQKNMEFVNQVKLEIGGCQECKRKLTSTDPALCSCFEFDHIDRKNKIKSISQIANDHRRMEVLKAEIAKCRLLCVNCHKKHTRRQLGMVYHATIQSV